MAQTDSQLLAEAEIIKNETVAGTNTAGRVGTMYEDIINNKVNNLYTSSFVTNSQTSSFIKSSQTSSYITSNQTSSFITAGTLGTVQTISGSLVINQNLTVLGSSSIQYITSSELNIGTSIITVNTATPSVRFGGLAVADSGSVPVRSGSLLFDSTNDQWIFVHQASATATSSVLIMGPETYGSIGNETNLTTNRLPKSVNAEHIGDSNITDTGTLVTINSSTQVTGSLTVSAGITGSLQGTASNAVTASYITGYVLNSQTSSFVTNNQTGSYLTTSSFNTYTGSTTSQLAGTASFAQTASFVKTAQTASYVTSSNIAGTVTSASYALTASYALNGGGGGTVSTASLLVTASATGNTITFTKGDNSTFGITVSGGTGAPGGSNTQIQFNSASVFQGNNGFTYNYTSSSLQQGYSTVTRAQYSHAQGMSTLTTGIGSHAEGSATTASAYGSHTEGALTQANGTYSHAEGYQSIASGSYSHAEGSATISIGLNSHAEGHSTVSQGEASHAEGESTTASEYASHAEGSSTVASGYASHAEGSTTTASAYASHAEGLGTTTVDEYQHAQGIYNLPVSGAGAFIVGNGTGDLSRSNLIYASGSILQVSGTLDVLGPTTNSNVARFRGGVDSTPIEIVAAGESLSVGYTAAQGSIGVGGDRLQVKYGNSDSSQWADAAYNLYYGNIQLDVEYYITYPGTYEVTVGSASGGNAIYLPAFNAWSYGAKVTVINATDEYVTVNTQVSEYVDLEGTTIHINTISPRSINEYVSTSTNWRILPSMKQLTYDNIDLSSGDFYIYTKGVYKFTQGSGDNLYFPNPGNFEGETLIISNQSANSLYIYNNGFRPISVDGGAYSSLDAYSVYQFVAIGGYWRIVSLIVA